MSEKGKDILNTFTKLLPKLSNMEQEKLLSFGEGMAFIKSLQDNQQSQPEPKRSA